jgi:NAD(P)-dependent dehydrogenase (short-subunit alcohol dehydrogenase family)
MDVMDRFSLQGCCSIVTGAAMGLGKAMAAALAEAGSDIVIADVDLDAAERAGDELRRFGVRTLTVRTDVTKPEDVAALVTSVMVAFGRIDVLVNNAGICRHAKAEEMSLGDWNDVLAVNLTGVFLMSQAVGCVMIQQKRGSIINISSMSGLIVNTPQCQCAYNASKAGVVMLTKSCATEWAQHGIRVNAIAPGYMKTELTRPYFEGDGDMVRRWMDLSPMKRPGTPDELQGLAVYLASDASSFMTGSVLTIDGGYTAW